MEFDEYIKRGIVRKCSPDKSRAEFLINESKNSLEGLKEIIKKIGINNKNSNHLIKSCYDIVMEIIRANMLLKGYTSSGQYSHEAEVSYIQKLEFSQNEISFLNELRYFRNSATYYGKILNEDYAKKVLNFTYKIYPKLMNILN